MSHASGQALVFTVSEVRISGTLETQTKGRKCIARTDFEVQTCGVSQPKSLAPCSRALADAFWCQRGLTLSSWQYEKIRGSRAARYVAIRRSFRGLDR